MMQIIRVFIFLFALAGAASAAIGDDMVFYKYADGNGYSVYVSSDRENPESKSAKEAIVKRLMGAKFSLSDISREFYQINITPHIMFFGKNLTQYNIEPLSMDRFSHIVWVDTCGRLIKTEVYDVNKRLVFAFGRMDMEGKDKSAAMENGEKKFKPADEKPFYKGFYHAFTKKMQNGVLHIVFADGINKFSVFINPNPTGDGAVLKIIYGNYLLSKVVSGIEYTVVGSVPYSFMEEIIKVLGSSQGKEFIKGSSKTPIIDEMFSKETTKEESKSEDIVK